jgi:8-oxo-dGTP diphosphatase
VLLQLRADWTHFGGTWSLVGGALDSHEDVVAAALREAREEAGVEPDDVRVVGQLPGSALGPWSYTYVVAWASPGVVAEPRTTESVEIRWFPLDGVGDLPMHEGLAADWDRLAEAVQEFASAAQQ